MKGGSVSLEMIFITALDKPTEGSPCKELTEQASSCGRSRTSAAGLPHRRAFSGLAVEVQKVLGGKASSQQYGQNERKSPLLPLLAPHTAYVIPIYLPKVARAHSFHRPIQLSHCRARRNKQCLFISCLSPQEDSCAR